MTETNKIRTEIRLYRDRVCFYFLAVSAAGAAFVTTRLPTLDGNLVIVLSLLSMIAFAASFYFGWKFTSLDEGLLWAEHAYWTERSQNPTLDKDLLHQATNSTSAKSERARRRQVFWCFCGGIFFGLAVAVEPIQGLWKSLVPFIDRLAA